MRILAIRGANLASLQGPFEVDLEKPPLCHLGLFAIAGPMGAGKSTLLDALCLALYARTPRLSGRGGAQLTRDHDVLRANDPRTLARRGAASCHAEVDFVGADGRAWRARWQVRRARGQAFSRLQDEELTLFDRESGARVGEGKESTLAEIERKVGLSYEEFCRSVLLAQGSFSAFLKARPEERAALLEKITGTELYSALSVRAFERARDESAALQDLETALSARPPLDAEARTQVEVELAEAGAARAAAEQALAQAQRAARAVKVAEQAARALAQAVDEERRAAEAVPTETTRAANAHDAVVEAAHKHAEAQPALLRAHVLDEQIASGAAARVRAQGNAAREASISAARILVELEREHASLAATLANADQALARDGELVALLPAWPALEPMLTALHSARVKLVEGEPCPLCGSTSHPAAHRTVAHGAVAAAGVGLAGIPSVLAGQDPVALRPRMERLRAEQQTQARARARLGEVELRRATALERSRADGERLAALERELQDAERAEQALLQERAALFAGAKAALVRARFERALSDAQTAARQAASALAAAQVRATESARRHAEARVAEEAARAELALIDTALDEAAAGAALTRASESWGQARAALVADDDARARARELGPRIAAQRSRVEVWGALSSLIGSSDGARLRIFAASLALDALLAHANAHLLQLAPRYRLTRIEGEADRKGRFDLELAVVDCESGDDARHTSSLSGGETFLVSLALALGLSGLSAEKTRVESLFVDEGFSSLDPETLEAALGAFEVLRASGRQIGVISHVPALAERIGAQVRVVKLGEGRSRVEVGAG